MKVKKIYVGADSTEVELGGGGGAGTAINASIFIDNDGDMYIKCNEGEIQDGDSVRLARYHTGKTGKHGEDEERTKYRGWIEPSAAHVAAQGLGMQIEFGYNKNGADYWKVTINNESITDYESDRPENDEGIKYTYSLQHQQGVAVYREGIRITEYLHFSVYYHEDSDMYFPARW